MIYTVTFNPAIDYVVHVDELQVGNINRCDRETAFFGGKGINVSLILKNLGIKSTALGFVAGFTGDAIEHGIEHDGINTDFVHLKSGLTRINVKIRSNDETDINAQGPDIDNDAIDSLFEKLDRLESGDILVLAGSCPKTLPSDIYERIMERLYDRGIHFVVDATRDLLVNSLKFKPFLIKPNNDELGEIFGVEINDEKTAAKYARKLQQKGAVNVLVSMGGKGAVLVDENGDEHYKPALCGKVVNTVGAGDSMVAGFIAGYHNKKDYGYALKLGTAAGGATAFSEGLANKELILKLLQDVQ